MKRFTFSLLLLSHFVVAQEIGQYPITHFKGEDGESFRSNVVYQDRNGNVYSGTDDGLKVFKGGLWEDFFYHGQSVTKLLEDPVGNLVLGGTDYFGKLELDTLGNSLFVSQSDILTGDRAFSNLQAMIPYTDGIFYHLDNRIIKINDQIIDYNYEDVVFAGGFNKNVLIQRQNEGLFIYAGNDFRKLNGSDLYANVPITSLADLGNGSFILFYDDQSILYNGDSFIPIRFRALRDLELVSVEHNDKGIFIGTVDSGVFQFTKEGELIRIIDLDSWCNHLFSDDDQNIWISKNDGVSVLKAGEGFMLIPFDEEKGRAVLEVQNEVLFGTNRGTYSVPISNGRLLSTAKRKVNDNVVNAFINVDGQFLTATRNDDFFGQNVNQLMFLNEADILLKADKSGLSFYEKPYRQWVYANHIYGLEEEVYSVIKDADNRLWAHASRSGVVLLNFDSVLNTIAPEKYGLKGVRTDHINGIFLINGQPIVTTANGIFEFNTALNQFQRSDEYNDLFADDNDILYLYQDMDEDIWYISSFSSGVVKIEDKGVQKSVNRIHIPELSSYLDLDHPGVYALSNGSVMLNGLDGFVYIDKVKIEEAKPLIIKLHRIENKSLGSSEFIPKTLNEKSYIFKSADDFIKLVFSSNYDLYQDKIKYSYQINNEPWSEWSDENSMEISLKGGTNSIKAKAQTGLNKESNVFVVPIVLQQPWYYEDWILYIAIGAGLLILGVLLYFVRRLLKRRKRSINDLMQENRDQKRQIRDLTEKNEVLSTQVITLISESDLQVQLKKLEDENDNPDVKKAVKKLSKKLKSERPKAAEMLVADPELMSKLKVKYPSLTKKDLRLCSLLKKDLTTKEIAPLLDISVRGVEISRYRLRKKLELNNEEVLSDFLKKI